MPDMSPENDSKADSKEPFVVAYEASTLSEALVVRGLLESAGIHSPDFDAADPFPMNEPPDGVHGAEVWVRESQVGDARRIISESAKDAATPEE
jgi:hypothetical protein